MIFDNYFDTILPYYIINLAKKGQKQTALIGNRYKLLSFDSGQSFHLFDIIDDSAESKDIAKRYPEIIKQMRRQLDEWIQSCKNSAKGNDYEYE